VCSQDRFCAVGLHFPLLVELCSDLEVGVWLSQCSLSLVCLYDNLAHLLFNSGWV
jgi:hypothetical protein